LNLTTNTLSLFLGTLKSYNEALQMGVYIHRCRLKEEGMVTGETRMECESEVLESVRDLLLDFNNLGITDSIAEEPEKVKT